MSVKAKAKTITILPREPLTQKAYAAIEAYARAKDGSDEPTYKIIKYTLEAERMRRRDLYQWLIDHGYKWKLPTEIAKIFGRTGRWIGGDEDE
jgi:hypothetical protein